MQQTEEPKPEISIHALREEGDNRCSRPKNRSRKFLSTPSARRATARTKATDGHHNISIHALREEGDTGGIGSA